MQIPIQKPKQLKAQQILIVFIHMKSYSQIYTFNKQIICENLQVRVKCRGNW